MADFVWRDGARLTPWMLYVILLLDAALRTAFGVGVLVSSGLRLAAEQEAIFRERYVTAANIRGRKVYDTRIWNGVRWYRISPLGTVAVPRFSNHEIQGDNGAVDIRDTGTDAGISVAGSVRGRWIREWCRATGLLVAEGDGFGEGWHFRVPGIFRTPPGSGAGSGGGNLPLPNKPKEIKVKTFHYEDARSKSDDGRLIDPGALAYLHTDPTQKPSKASTVVGGAGPYSLTAHVYAEGTPGDRLDIAYVWDDTKTDGPHSPNYTERLVIGADGTLFASIEFKRSVAPGYAVYLRAVAPATNKAPVKTTRLDSDAYLFTVA
ncbi:hypothetical protein [Microbacterium sp.]|uniref:hypothetical protein n=1 Tax=Microbacterium sp. TaxID=51671 RepID=UPI003F71012F